MYEESCCECAFVEILKNFGVQADEKMLKMCISLSEGFGVGQMCGALLGAVCASGVLLESEDVKKCRLLIINRFNENFKTFNCANLCDFKDKSGYCDYILNETIKIGIDCISKFYHSK